MVKNITKEQAEIIAKLNQLMIEAKNCGIGFVFDKTTSKMSAFNSEGIDNVDLQEFSDNCNLSAENMSEIGVAFDTHYYSDGDFLVAS